MSRQIHCSLVLCLVAGLLPATVSAQAWLPGKGAFNTTLLYNNVLNKQHWLPNGDTIDVGHTRSETLAFLANYGITDRLMVSGSLPYVTTEFYGTNSHGGQPGFPADDGDAHSSFTDLRVGLHYQALERPFALAPFVAYVLPISDYSVRGHAAQGRDLEELILGFSAGKSLDPWVARSYAQLRYSYGFVEELQGVSNDRSNLNLELGTFLTPRWNVSLYGAKQWSHGGIDVPVPPSSPYFLIHDQIAGEEFFNAGVGSGYQLTPEITAFGMYMYGFSGKNGHRMNQGVTVGFSYGFRPRATAVFSEDAEDQAEGQ